MKAPAKINLALVVGPPHEDGKHEVVTVLQRVDLCDEVTVEASPDSRLSVVRNDAGAAIPDDIVLEALRRISDAAGIEPHWRAGVTKAIPIAAGLGGGSSDAAAALLLANELLAEPLAARRLHELAAALGADVPFFLGDGPQLGTGDGSILEPLDLPQDYAVVLLVPDGVTKESTAAVYAQFDESGRAGGFAERRTRLLDALATNDLAGLPGNDLASSPVAAEMLELGAFRADVSGAGPIVYGLFRDDDSAGLAAAALAGRGRVWIAAPKW